MRSSIRCTSGIHTDTSCGRENLLERRNRCSHYHCSLSNDSSSSARKSKNFEETVPVSNGMGVYDEAIHSDEEAVRYNQGGLRVDPQS